MRRNLITFVAMNPDWPFDTKRMIVHGVFDYIMVHVLSNILVKVRKNQSTDGQSWVI